MEWDVKGEKHKRNIMELSTFKKSLDFYVIQIVSEKFIKRRRAERVASRSLLVTVVRLSRIVCRFHSTVWSSVLRGI